MVDTAPRITRITTPTSNGSGYVIAPRLVLTGAHVVPEVGGHVRVRTATDHRPYTGAVIWRGTPKGHDDAALIEVTDPDWTEPVVTTRWGRLVTTAPRTSCEVWGFPDLVQRDGRAAETAQLVGTVAPGNHFVNHRHVMDLSDHPPNRHPHGSRQQEQGRSLWAGLSGAAMRCGDGQLLVGVVSADLEHRDHAALEVVPAYALHHDPRFRKVLAEHGVSQVLEPVELNHLAHSPRSHQRPSPTSLLEAHHRVVDFHGREEVMDTLVQWCGDDEALSAMVVHGPGGQGKTRLGHELTAHLARPDAQGRRWATLWLRDNATTEELDRVKDTTAPLLLVLDYAETRTAQLIRLLELCDRPPGSCPVRLLLLVRAVGEWWEQVNTATGHLLADITQQLALPPLVPRTVERVREYRTALHHLAHALPAARTPRSADWAQAAAGLTEPDLSGSEWDTVLSVHMRALADLLDATQTSTMVTADSAVEGRVLAHEYRYWDHTAAAHGLGEAELAQPLRDVLALAFTLTPTSIEEADQLLQHAAVLEGQTTARRHQIRRWVTGLYPTDGPGAHGQLQPDRLLEYFLGQRLQRNPALFDAHLDTITTAEAERLVTLYARAAAHPALASVRDHLTRLCTRHVDLLGPAVIAAAIQVEHPEPLTQALEGTTADPNTSLEVLEKLSDSLPRFTQRLDAWAEHLAGRVAERRAEQAFNDPEANLLAFIGSLVTRSNRLAALGSYEEALKVIDQILRFLHILGEQNIKAFRPELAASLNNKASHLSKFGRYEEAFEATDKAIAHYEKLVERSPGKYLPQFAICLNNQADSLAHSGNLIYALEKNDRALRIVRVLAKNDPNAHYPDLAMLLGYRSNHLSDIGKYKAALNFSTQALQIRQNLYEKNPDAHRPDLAMALNSLSVSMGKLERYEQAFQAINEAVAHYEVLAGHRPDAYLPHLALSLHNQAVSLRALGRTEEAVEPARESFEIRRILAKKYPAAYKEELNSSLLFFEILRGV